MVCDVKVTRRCVFWWDWTVNIDKTKAVKTVRARARAPMFYSGDSVSLGFYCCFSVFDYWIWDWASYYLFIIFLLYNNLLPRLLIDTHDAAHRGNDRRSQQR